MAFVVRPLLACCVVLGFMTTASAEEPAAKQAPYPSVPADAELSDDAIFTKLFASRDYCKKIDAANAAGYDKGLEMLTADSVEETKAFKAKPDFADIVGKAVAEFEAREKDSAMAGTGKAMCENYLKMQ